MTEKQARRSPFSGHGIKLCDAKLSAGLAEIIEQHGNNYLVRRRNIIVQSNNTSITHTFLEVHQIG
jgi:hypothetical protein